MENIQKIKEFYKEYKQCMDFDDGESKYDLFTEVGQLTLKYNLTKNDVLYVLNNFDCSFDYDRFLYYTYEEWDDFDDDFLWKELLNDISGYTFPKDSDKVINILKYKYSLDKK